MSLITGLGIAQILNGLADVVSDLKNVKMSLPWLLMVLSTFLNLIQEWFYTYQYASLVEAWSLKIIMGLMVYPILLFVLSRMLIPTGLRSEESDLDAYYFDQWKWFFSVSCLIIATSVLQDIFISGYTLADQFPKFMLVGTNLAFIIFNIQNKKAHLIFNLLQMIGIILFLIIVDEELKHYDPIVP